MSTLKIVIVIVFCLLLASLASSLLFLFKDKGAVEKKRTMITLGLRVSMAVLLMILITYGVSTGQLKSQAPWRQIHTEQIPDLRLP